MTFLYYKIISFSVLVQYTAAPSDLLRLFSIPHHFAPWKIIERTSRGSDLKLLRAEPYSVRGLGERASADGLDRKWSHNPG